MSLVLVAARPPRPEPTPDAIRVEVWGAVSAEAAHLPRVPASAVVPGRLDLLAAAISSDADAPKITYAATAEDATRAVDHAIAAGAVAVAVLPIALAVDDSEGSLAGDADLQRLRQRLDLVRRQHPTVEIAYIGPPFDDAPALEAAIAALRPAGSEEPALLAGAIERAFHGDAHRFARFVAALQEGVPSGTRLALRGSAVQGVSYTTGEPFDARGPATSDLDVVLLGDEAMARWSSDAFYLPGVNAKPLYDDAPDVADPRLEAARIAAQEVAGRPVALQAMARWFLDLRSALQGTPYVIFAG